MEVEDWGCRIPKRYFMHMIFKPGKKQEPDPACIGRYPLYLVM